ncbi:MAG TPA: hypothetical protein DHV14_05660, partial [Micrococcales bacterium]|nr:hypothetical protein [Micrococcales bacterium]
ERVLAVVRPVVETDAPTLLLVHRRLADGELVLLLNVASEPATGRVAAGEDGWQVWDPRDGSRAALAGDVTVPPHGALVLATGSGLPALEGGAGVVEPAASASGPMPVPVEWRDEDGAVAAFPLLADWRTPPGSRTVSAEVDVPDGVTRLELDLGDGVSTGPVTRSGDGGGPAYRTRYRPPAGTAVVLAVDGAPVGALWAPPYRIAVPVSPGPHTVEVRSLGSLVGAVVGNAELVARQEALTERYGQRFVLQEVDREPTDLVLGLRTEPVLRLP